jgi:hypothetical protein
MNLGNLIENALKQIEADKVKEAESAAEAADEDELMENTLFSDEATSVLSDEAFTDFNDAEEEWEEADEEFLQRLISGEEDK